MLYLSAALGLLGIGSGALLVVLVLPSVRVVTNYKFLICHKVTDRILFLVHCVGFAYNPAFGGPGPVLVFCNSKEK